MSLWVGTYEKNGGGGLYPVWIRESRLEVGDPEPNVVNASFGLWNERHQLAYFVEEQDAGLITAWRHRKGHWSPVAAAGSGGSMPCYLDLHPTSGLLAVANYADGVVGLVRLDEASGAIREVVDMACPTGRGFDPHRQQGPHAHCVRFSEDGSVLYHVDLGLDRIMAYPILDDRLGDPVLAFVAPPGSGPRHLLLHPDRQRAVLICELSAELHLLERRGAAFASCARVPTSSHVPDGKNLGGHLALLSGQSLVAATNRGHDDLSLFELGQVTLQEIRSIPTHGRSPRHFWSDGDRAIVANEESGDVTLVGLGHGGGVISQVNIPGACFVFKLPDASKIAEDAKSETHA